MRCGIYALARATKIEDFRRFFFREVRWAGNVESFRITFLSKESILLGVAKTYHHRRREYPQLFREPANSHLQIIELTSPAKPSGFFNYVISEDLMDEIIESP